jgi:enoyl-CoA hydratase/carnithine racemase
MSPANPAADTPDKSAADLSARNEPTRLRISSRQAHGRRWERLHLSSASGVNPLSGATVAALRARLAAIDEAVAAEAGDPVGDPAGGAPDTRGASDEPTVPHALLLTAEGRCFCAGADIKEFRSFDAAAFSAYMADVLALYAGMVQVRRPIVSVVHADARGGGAALALCSDFVVAAEDARFALPESHRGLAGGGWLMPRLMGRQRAAEMVLLGREFTAGEMAAMGLVNRVCAAGDLEATVDELCAALAAMPASAFGVGKRSLAGGLSVGLREAMDWHVRAQTEAFVKARAAGLL